MPVILYTDALLFFLVAVVLGFAAYASRHEHLRVPWRKVARSRMGMSAAMVLLVYVVIGLLDSMHFRPQLSSSGNGDEVRYSNELLSVFDVLVGPLREREEKTYSAPFATHLYARETVQGADGMQTRVFPRLQYGGRHLEDGDDVRSDVMKISAGAAGYALLAWLVLWLVLSGLLALSARQGWMVQLGSMLRGQTPVPWRVLMIMLGILLLVGFVAASLSVKYHIFGTDKVGQDVFYQSLKSIRTGLVIGTLTTLITLPFAVMLGIMAGYFRGWTDDIIQYIYTTLNSIPHVLLIAAAVLLLHVYMNANAESFNSVEERADLRMLFLCLILGVTSWTGLCRLLRGETFKVREIDYVQAATAFGVGHTRIMLRHILPNVMHLILIAIVLDFSGLVLAEAVLSYIGIGVDPTTNSWGNMINSARLEMAREPIVWWSLAASFVFMLTLVLAANLFSDVVRDAFDPRVTSK